MWKCSHIHRCRKNTSHCLALSVINIFNKCVQYHTIFFLIRENKVFVYFCWFAASISVGIKFFFSWIPLGSDGADLLCSLPQEGEQVSVTANPSTFFLQLKCSVQEHVSSQTDQSIPEIICWNCWGATVSLVVHLNWELRV